MSHSTSKPKQSSRQEISTLAFYGVPKLRDTLRLTALDKKNRSASKLSGGLPQELTTLIGPSSTWRVFRKQDVALNFARIRKNKLMTFVYQQTTGERIFIVAHPSVYWWHDVQRDQVNRCSFEIIPQHSVCKLYFDLEFETSFNSNKNGIKMTEMFIGIVNSWLRQEFLIEVNRSHILDLDSTTDSKFSRHLIYQLPNTAFRDNYDVGNFVKMICYHLKIFLGLNESRPPRSVSSIHHADEILAVPSVVNKYLQSIDKSILLELLVSDGKGNTRLFCDEAVYTKNRHFRLYCSTKRMKNAPLVLSPQNLYTCSHSSEEGIFLDSLISYFPSDNYCDLRLLEYKSDNLWQSNFVCSDFQVNRAQDKHTIHELVPVSTSYSKSPHPEVDNFISSLVTPGRVWRWFYFSSSNIIMYDIIGYRYCGNVNRQHRSNGIKYVVNLSTFTYYQKCYDPDCTGYRSSERQLPLEIAFLYEDEEEFKLTGSSSKDIVFEPTFDSFGLVDQEMVEVLDAVEITHNMLD